MKTSYTLSWMSDPLCLFLEIAERSNDKYYKVKSGFGLSSKLSSERGSDQE